MEMIINKKIMKIIEENNITMYSLSKVTGLNRTTLTNALRDGKRLNQRQVKCVLDYLPISVNKKKELYNEFMLSKFGGEYMAVNNAILDMFKVIDDTINNKNKNQTNIYANINEKINVYKGMDVYKAIEAIFYNELKQNKENDGFIGIFLPFEQKNVEMIANNIRNVVAGIGTKSEISIFFEFFYNGVRSEYKNIKMLSNILPFVIDENNYYSIYYTYRNLLGEGSFFVYPYYIVFKDKLLLINSDVDEMAVVRDKNIIENYRERHSKNANNVKTVNKLNYNTISIENALTSLNSASIEAYKVYALAYQPCFTAFLTLEDYKEIIKDECPYKEEILKIIEQRLNIINSTSSRYAFFNKQSIDKFVEDGNCLPFNHLYMKTLTLKQRKKLLNTIFEFISKEPMDMRAYAYDDINISSKFEITNVQNNMDFVILIYDENNMRMINIKEPLIAHRLIKFYEDLEDSPITMTTEETKDVLKQGINKLEKMIAEEE